MPSNDGFTVPPPSAREWYRHSQTGDRGYKIVGPDGKDYLRYDREAGGRNRSGFADRLFNSIEKANWVPDNEHRPMTKFQVARIAFEADKMLLMALGRHDLARAEWLMLKPATRLRWADDGPSKDPLRKKLWHAIMGAVGDLADRESQR